MDVKSLRCFLAVAEKLNFSRAAESLYISQPALSLRVNALEQELGVPLFRRTRQKVFLTEAGAAVLPEIHEIISKLDALPQMAQNGFRSADAETGCIRISLDTTLPDTMLDDLTRKFAKFYEKYPKISVDIDSVDFNQYENALLARKVDLCFIGFKHSERTHLNPAFNVIPFQIENMVLAYTGAPDIPTEQILNERTILLLNGEERWNSVLLSHMESEKLVPHTATIASGFALCVNLMKTSTATFMPISFFESLKTPNLNYREMDIPDARVISCFVWDKMNFNPALQLMINMFEQEPTADK